MTASRRRRRPWLLNLYPAAWRRRYGDEVGDMLADRPISLRIAIDLIAGAIDVWLHPSVTLAAASAAAPSPSEDRHMLTRILRFDCAALAGADITKADHWKSGVTVIVGTAVLTLAWIGLRVRFGNTTAVESLSFMPFIVALMYSMRYTYLKGRSASVQAVFIGGMCLLVAAILLAAGQLAAQL